MLFLLGAVYITVKRRERGAVFSNLRWGAMCIYVREVLYIKREAFLSSSSVPSTFCLINFAGTWGKPTAWTSETAVEISGLNSLVDRHLLSQLRIVRRRLWERMCKGYEVNLGKLEKITTFHTLARGCLTNICKNSFASPPLNILTILLSWSSFRILTPNEGPKFSAGVSLIKVNDGQGLWF